MENFVEKDKEAATSRCVELDNNKIWARRTDPYGFWKINFDAGRMPEFLMGSYTSVDQAMKDINLYLKEKGRVPK